MKRRLQRTAYVLAPWLEIILIFTSFRWPLKAVAGSQLAFEFLTDAVRQRYVAASNNK